MIGEMGNDFGAPVDNVDAIQSEIFDNLLNEVAFFAVGFEQGDVSLGQYQLQWQTRYACAGTDVDYPAPVEPTCCSHVAARLNGYPERTDEELLDDSLWIIYRGQIGSTSPLDQQLTITPEALGCGFIDLHPDGTCRLN